MGIKDFPLLCFFPPFPPFQYISPTSPSQSNPISHQHHTTQSQRTSSLRKTISVAHSPTVAPNSIPRTRQNPSAANCVSAIPLFSELPSLPTAHWFTAAIRKPEILSLTSKTQRQGTAKIYLSAVKSLFGPFPCLSRWV